MASTPSLFVHVASTSSSWRFAVQRRWCRRPLAGMALSPDLAGVWREIQGSSDWNGLIQPLNPILRNEIIRYGEFANICYGTFEQDPNSKRYLNCKHGKGSILNEELRSGYNVTKYIYANSDVNVDFSGKSSCSRWIGYVAVASDDEVWRLGRRDIVVAFRGTVTAAEWIANFMSFLTPARLDPLDRCPDVEVVSGFLRLYTSEDKTCRFSNGSCREQALREISRLIDTYKSEELSITLTGHSMGSSLALLFGYDVAELGLNVLSSANREIPITVYSFAGPRVGNSAFQEKCAELGVKVLRVVNVNDPVTKVPGVLFNENFRINLPWSCSSCCCIHLGVELALEFSGFNDPVAAHDLGRYIGFLRFGEMVGACPELQEGGGGEEEDGEDVFDKVKTFWSLQRLELWPWQDTAANMVQVLKNW